MRVVVGVGGGIAAYKACQVVRTFTEAGHDVRVIPTEAALRFVGAATFEALSGNPVSTTVFDNVDEVEHVRLGHEADLVVVAPATADLMARLAHGRADDLLTASCLVATCPVVLAPAMHTEMWRHPATRDNVALLRSRGTVVLEPAHGRLTGADSGPGRLPDPEHIAHLGLAAVERPGIFRRTLEGCTVVVSAGGTREPLDPVRFLGNSSSGRQGFAVADVAAQRGAEVRIVAGAVDELPLPSGATVEQVETAREMEAAVVRAVTGEGWARPAAGTDPDGTAPDTDAADPASPADVLVMAAAVADYRPAVTADAKLKKGGDTPLDRLELTENPDILRGVVDRRAAGTVPAALRIVGFAAETGDPEHTPLEHARAKLARKGCDILMCNPVGSGRVFGRDDSSGWLLRSGVEGETVVPPGSKLLVAAAILDEVDAAREAAERPSGPVG
ncbi:bifunctional phosphopantothenoylcysteine decarboxylase/phosphopantothenate--cysteine ligase CoaBC [Corynebacterium bovis]|uniref:bifunctional phosphopantothenoylcysteine decarboxylase/phosphopantothenate--cysteine ligase CoaBC n=1 Tax=Corynebacterium bovis TaxID=36808 RepID=UPI00068049F7|nr:bifunctional phosphopantothenoylcysteine decarboxylase/phosphopantothenate--cysteine ligase CoaBC [Corynebacterium bovis]RRO84749.1 bifunctional phosphopantothenoylcysteine decarboxylase/phosphopantothenate--cysteine ligase CoaBC [Corynebacterium bovis]RRO94739.1 bifunctional phosphopantothenoylcysteine decarboxylase/phosphopantothenate--cysteine ligase CoaBC [Corynebacterium bovis]